MICSIIEYSSPLSDTLDDPDPDEDVAVEAAQSLAFMIA
eukprot:CAMPEP_0203737222 /NCGR_PEP_ID=MMETSP0092-20131115/38368_1 /ASSEMBLY_ACC=CAM_ASM_001090 /TAXON_ID=426623 /ORGANISM="Chaetoceros affinis, Strain CCMP159" /LENGTH=38 /DNA_ID= /DNA_START= /DNA_END= /DNA_ORIENTATION=